MPKTVAEIDDLKSKLALARKQSLNFGLCLGRGGDGTVLLLHRRKPPDLLARRAKRKGETQKLACGQLELTSRTVTMTCDGSPPPMLARHMRLYLREFDLLFRVEIIAPEGDVIEAEGTDDRSDPAPLLERTTPKPNKQLDKWNEVQPAFERAVARTVAAGGPKADAIKAAWAGAIRAAEQGKYKAALKVAKTIKPLVITKPAPTAKTAQTDPNAAKWAVVEEKLAARLAAKPANAETLQKVFAVAQAKARKGEYKSAGLVAKKLVTALDKAQASTKPDPRGFDAAHDALTQRLRNVGLAFPTAKLAKRLRAIRLDAERPPHDLPAAMAAVTELDATLTATASAWFADTKTEATKALTTICSYRGVKPQHARLEARLAGMAPAFRRTPPDYDEIAATHAAILADRAALKAISDRYHADYDEWVAKKKNWCDLPLAGLTDPAHKPEKTRIANLLTQAKSLLDSNDMPRAKRLITDIYWDIKAVQERADSDAAFATHLANATAAIKSLGALKNAGLDSEIVALTQDIASAAARAKAQDFYTAELILDPIPTRVSALKEDAARQADKDHLKSLTTRADQLNNAPLGTQIRDQLAQATPAALRKAEAMIAAAEITDGQEVDKDQIRALTANPDTFDDLLEALPDADATALLAARYSASRPSPGLQSLHTALKGTNRLATAQFKPFTRDKDDDFTISPGPIFHAGISGDVITSAFNPFSDRIGALSDPDQLGKIDADCVATTTSEGDNPAYGRWSALHQIGQAINTSKNFMHANGHKKVFGGWQDHGSDVSPVAQTIARHFNIDRSFVERAMTGKAPEIPPPPEDTDPETWTQPYQDALNWLTEARHRSALWNSDARSAAHRIGTRVIHESAPGHWVSYEYAARAKGITGRQFRSPGDWFAELYAAYLSNVMNPAHPARDWLVKL